MAYLSSGILLLGHLLASLSLHPPSPYISIWLSCPALFCLPIGQISFIYQPMGVIPIQSIQKDHPIAITPSAPSFPGVPIVLSGGLRPHGIVSVRFGMVIAVVLVQLTLEQSYWWDFMGVVPDITRISQKVLWSSGLHSLPSLLPPHSLRLGCSSGW